ncbi:MAG: hypothetical protein Q9209_005989 [Squamulea sp. 1 TL-2023]
MRDYTYTSINHTVWAVIEGNVVIIAACIPGLRSFVQHIRSRCVQDRRPPPIRLGSKISQQYLSNTSTTLPSPISLRRMEPRPSGSVSGSLQAPKSRAYHRNSLAMIESQQAVQDEADVEWGQGYGNIKGKERAKSDEKVETDVGDKDVEDSRGRVRGMEAGEATEVDDRDIGTVGDVEREREVQELREILEENKAEERRSWLEKVRERVDKRMTV